MNHRLRIKKSILFFIFLLLFLFGASFTFALEISYPKIPGAAAPQDFISSASSEEIMSLWAKYLLNLSLWAAGLTAILMLVVGGIRFLLSSGSPEKVIAARKQILGAFLGLSIIFSSYFILKALGPQFIDLNLPKLETIKFKKKPYVSPPALKEIETSIDAELPFGRLIEDIFESYISDYPKPDNPKPARLTRIENNLSAINYLTEQLADNGKSLKSYSDKCSCTYTDPDPKCNHYGCSNCPPNKCTCDPCKNVRSKIQSTEKENLDLIYLGISNIPQINAEDKEEKITTALTQEISKTEEEIRLLKDGLQRLERTEKFIWECPWQSLNSWAIENLKADFFTKNGWTVNKIKIAEEVNIRYYPEKYPWYKPSPIVYTDYATFYCSVGGTIEQEFNIADFTPSESSLTGEESVETAEDIFPEEMACPEEAPAGEIIDRTKRATKLLINKMEFLNKKNKELINAVDKLQVLISQCTSENCKPICFCISCGPDCKYCLEIGCFGIACPIFNIHKQASKIEKIRKEILTTIEGAGKQYAPQTIGIKKIIKEIGPSIVSDLNEYVRIPMRECKAKKWDQRNKNLFAAEQTVGSIIPPYNKLLTEICFPETTTAEGATQPTLYGECLEKCYLEIKQTDYRACLQLCLYDKAKNLSQEEKLKLSRCTHPLNFYCCHATY